MKTKTIPLEVPEDWSDIESAKVISEPAIPWQGLSHKVICQVQLLPKPSWSWCESPTDEMALLRPDCEVKDEPNRIWNRRVLVYVAPGRQFPFYVSNKDRCEPWILCRVRIDNATGRVIERWEQ